MIHAGSGSLLLQFSKVLGDKNVSKGYFGQEINLTTYNLCRINMFLHDINYSKFHIAHGDTLLDPKHEDDEPFDAIVSNPPYSTKWVGDSNPILINDERFSKAGVLVPKNAADLAFTMHMLSYLSNSGTAAIVEFPGVLYRGNAEAKIREYLVKENVIDCVIALPDNLFFGTSIATCILVLKKNKKDDTTLFIDASKEFVKEGKKNKLKAHNREKILQTYIERKTIKHFCALANIEKIQENDYNLSVNRIYQASKSSPVIIFDDFTTATQWVDFPFKVKSSAMKILFSKNPTINIRFIFFYMQTIPYNIGGEHARHWISRYSQLEVPIPPLEIQQEIVKILDQFSILTTDLLAGIPAEIKARKKQYEYYREKLLTFKPLTPLNSKELA